MFASFSKMTGISALLLIGWVGTSCKSELTQVPNPKPAESEAPPPTNGVATPVANPSSFEPETTATRLSSSKGELVTPSVKITWPVGTFAAGFLSMNPVPKIDSPSPSQTVLGSWSLSIADGDSVPIAAAKNGSIELFAELPIGLLVKSVQVLLTVPASSPFLGNESSTTVISPIEIFENENPLRVKFSGPLSSGTYSFVVSLSNNAASVTYDTIAPTTTVLLANGASDGIVNASEFSSSSALAQVTGSDFSTAQYLAVSSGSTCSAQTFSSSSIPLISSLNSDGTYIVCAKLTDAAGNIAYPASATITRDTDAPDTTSIALTGDLSDGYLSLAESTGTTGLTVLSGTSDYATAHYLLVSSAVTDCSIQSFVSSTVFIATAISSDGSYKICAKFTDTAGNTGYHITSAFTRDILPPSFTSLGLGGLAADSIITGAERTQSSSILGTLTASGQTTTTYDLVASATACSSSLTYAADVLVNDAALTTNGATYKICVDLSDAAGNHSYWASSNLTLDLSQTITSFTPGQVALDGRYVFSWVAYTADHYRIRKLAGSTPPTLATGSDVAGSIASSTTSSTALIGADTLPISFTLFACSSVTENTTTCATTYSATIDRAFTTMRNDSDGATAQFTTAVSAGSQKMGYATTSAVLLDWNGISASSTGVTMVSPISNVLTVDFTALSPWTKRYIRIALPSSDGKGVDLSPVYVYGRLPAGMVYVDAEAWPGQIFTPTFGTLSSEGYASPYSFAIDKYEGTLSGTVSCTTFSSCSGSGHLDATGAAPTVSTSWYSFEKACANRASVAKFQDYDTTSTDLNSAIEEPKRYHLPSGVEFVVATYQTPDVDNEATGCNLSGADWTDTSASSPNCTSRYGSRNLIGNAWDFTAELGDSGTIQVFKTATFSGINSGVLGSHNLANNYVAGWDWPTAFPSAVAASAVTAYSSDYYYTFGSISALGANARATLRGGDANSAAISGRFTMRRASPDSHPRGFWRPLSRAAALEARNPLRAAQSAAPKNLCKPGST